MRVQKRWARGATVIAVLFTMFVRFATTASAAPPAFEPDPNSSNGSIVFYNAAGAVITSGNDLAHLFDYAVASSDATRTGTTKASTFFGFPDHTKPDSQTWFSSQATAATTFPNATAPPPINGFGARRPVNHAGPTEANLSALLGTTTLDTTPGYANVVQIRLKDSGAGIGNGVLSTPFWSTDIMFDQAAGTWTQVFPAPVGGPTATTTTLAGTPNPSTVGSTVTMTATETPASPGSVQFKDGAANLGGPVAVNASGVATTTTSSLTAGSHSLSAVFTPTDTAAFSGSTGTFTASVTSAAAATTTTLAITPPSPITVGTASTLTATVAPGTAAGAVQFFDGATPIGVPVPVVGGTAVKTTTFTVNTHLVKAVFTPTDPAAFGGSESSVVSYVVNPVPATATSTTMVVTPISPQAFGATLTLTATVTPSSAVGTVQFLDGTTVIGTGTVSGGTATTTTSTLGAGTHQLSAKFIPTSPANFGTSQSAPTGYVITPATPTVSLSVTPTSPAAFGAPVTMSATVSPSGAGSVQFFDGATAIGGPVTVSGGAAQLVTTALAAGSHALSAVFTPTSANYTTGTSNVVSYVVSPAPPGSTTTALTVTPAGPVTEGTSETLKATVSPASATGTVQFFDGLVAIGSPVVVAAGLAQMITTLTVGSHSLSAHFVSGSPGTFNDSVSAALSYQVKPPPTATNTSLTVTPAGPVTFGTAVTLSASVSPSAAPGTVSFLDGTTVLGSKPAAGGAATLTTVGLSGGQHSLTARFVPTSPLDFTGSTSGPVTLRVTFASTAIALSVTPAGPVTVGATVTLSATVTPSTAAGRARFYNGNSLLGTSAVSRGKATLKTTALPVGTASLTASFVPDTAANFRPSTSAAVTLAVRAAPPGSPTPTPTVGPTGAVVSTPPGAGGGENLAVTGADVLGIGVLGLALTVVGSAALLVAVRRRRGTHRT